MNKIKIISLSLCASILGFLLYAWSVNWIIIATPSILTTSAKSLPSKMPIKKSIDLYFFKNQQWLHENIVVSTPQDDLKQLEIILNKLCTLLEEEQLIGSNIQIHNIACTADESELLISCTKNPFADCKNIYEKLILLETFLKNIRNHTKQLFHVRFLLLHEPLRDEHINFSMAFPSTGYLEKQ